MASLFWVAGSTAYDGVTNRLATTTGGTATVAAITSADTVTFDANSPAAAVVTTTAAISATAITIGTGFTGSFTLGNTLTTTGAVTLNTGTLNTNGQACNWGSFNSNNANVRTLTLGSSAITITAGSTVWTTGGGGTMTVTANTANITLTGASANFSTSLGAWGGTISFTGSGGSQILATGGSIGNLTRTGTAAKTDSLQFTSNVTVTGTLTLTGNSSTANRLLVQSSLNGTQRTITAGTVSASNVDFGDIIGAGAASWNLSAISGLSGDVGGNSGITFTTSATQYRVGASSSSTLWSDSTKWASTSGGVGGSGRVPLPQDDVIIDNNSSALNVNVPIDMFRAGRTIDISGFTRGGTFTNLFTSTATNVYGSLIVGSIVFTASGTQAVTFAGRGSYTISSNNIFNSSLSMSAPGGTYTLTTNFTIVGNFTHTDGTLIDNGFSVIISSFISNSSRTRTLTKSGAWSLTSTAATSVWNVASAGLTLTDSSSISITTASANSRNFVGAAQTYGTLNYTVAGSTGSLAITGANSFGAVNFTDSTNARTLTLPASTTNTIRNGANFNVNGTSGKLMTLNSSIGGTKATLAITTGTVNCDYLAVVDNTASVTTPAYAGPNGSISNTTNWLASAAPATTNSGFFAFM